MTGILDFLLPPNLFYIFGVIALVYTTTILLEDVFGPFLTSPNQQSQPSSNTPTPGSNGPTVTRDNEAFANYCFPHSHQYWLRLGLIDLLQQPWLFLNQPEPAGAFQFLLSDAENGKQQCSICSKLYRRGGRALEHIRTHLGHKPFVCFGGRLGCSRPTW